MSIGAGDEERQPNPISLPDGLEAYRRTPTFTDVTVPAGLRKDHMTKHDVWGLIHVLEGSLLYRITDKRRIPCETTLTLHTPPGIVEPTILHHVEPVEGVCFFVEFYRAMPTSRLD